MRCLALAQAWQDEGGNVTFLLAPGSPLLEERLLVEGIAFVHLSHQPGSQEDAFETADMADKIHSSWVVVDGYHFGAEFQKELKKRGLKILCIDDFGHAEHYYADIVLNQNIGADISCYRNSEPYTRLLLGTKFVLLRREFLKWAGRKRSIPYIAHKVLVTFGGGDPDNVTLKVLDALKQIEIEGLEVIIVVGSVNPHYESLQHNAKDRPGFSLRKNVKNMPELMAWADVAISAGGSTCWEFAFASLPSIMYPIAENQIPLIAELSRIGAVLDARKINIDNPESFAAAIADLLVSFEKRSALSKTIHALVDSEGRGANQVVRMMASRNIYFRSA
jgi:UDP-2,4-diacetamido-2,4,6-trideoxy-beta-L-altropyranose hydrolase